MKIACVCSLLLGVILILLPYGYEMIGLAFLFLALLFGLSRHRKTVGSLLAIVCPLLLILEIPIIQAAHTDAPDDVDYIILLGAGVNGTTPSLALLDRLETATDFLQAHPDCKVIVTGGQGPGEDITEAQAMETYLLSQNIAADRIIKEDQAENTYQNIQNSFALIENESTAKVAVLSSEYHMCRAKLIARQLGHSVYGIAAPTSTILNKINYFLREAPALIKTWLTALF